MLAGMVSGQTPRGVLTPVKCPDGIETYVTRAVYFGITPPLREMPQNKSFNYKGKEEKEVENAVNPKYKIYGRHPFLLPEDPVWQKQDGTYMPQNAGPIQNFEGINNLSGVYPPDTQGDVGPDKYIQVVNMKYEIFSKTGTSLLGPSNLSTIWSGIPAPWNGTNNGDPVVLYDQAAQRWIISQFSLVTGNYAELVAISQTSDPTGSWYQYVFQFGNQMPDYPKLGIWPDGYYLSFNQFTGGSTQNGVGACALERSKMLNGDASATMQYKNLGSSADPWAMLPSDWDGINTPLTGEPDYFTYFNDWSTPGSPVLNIWSFHVDWTNPANTTFTQTYSIATVNFDSQICTATRERCIPQPSTSVRLEALSDRLMYRLQYRNFGSYQAMVTNHTVDVDGSGHAGIRWYELRNSGSGWGIYQQGTYAPDASHRWVGSIAMNGLGDIALGFSLSDGSSTYPSIHYTGRRFSDPLGSMTIAEQTVINGSGCQTGSACRWGDYAMMSVDPSDDLTFWFTTEYIQTTGTANWQTRIASFKFFSNPIVTTTAATAITTTSATLNGSINPNGLSSTYHFDWGSTITYGNSTPVTSAGSGSTAINVSANISGLTAGTTYHFRVVGDNSDGTTDGNDMTFIPGGAIVTTTPASAITTTTATAGGTISTDGGAAVTARGTCWSTSANPTISGNHTSDGSGSGTFTSSLTGLNANTTYHIRAYATNSVGTWYGADLTFNTLCAIYSLPFNEGFANTTIPNCWTQVDYQGNNEIWQFGMITGGNPNPNLNGNYAYLYSHNYGSGNSQNADLVTPVLDCSAFTNVTLQFNHYFKSSSGSSGTLSYSIDGGSNWTTIQTFTTTSLSNPTAFSQVISAATNQSQVKFRWNYTGTYGWYWAIDDVSVTGTSSNTLSVTPSNQNVPASPAGSTTFNVTCSTNWNATSNQSWCTVTPSGSGNGIITANYTANTLVGSRVATITVSASGAPTATVTVTQAGVTPTLAVTPSNQNVPDSPAGSTTFNVTSNTGWTVTVDSAWCSATPSGSGNGLITANYAINPTINSRVAHVTVTVTGLSPVIVTVTQAAGSPTLSVTPSNQDVPASPSGYTQFSVTSNASWLVASDASWCTINPPNDAGNGTITANYTENTATSSRIANITVTVSGIPPVVVTVTQDAALPSLSVTPSNQDVPASPVGSTTFSVASNTGWTVTSDQTWCTVNPSGSGNGTITANYTENTSTSSRVANITVTVTGMSPVVVTVTQSGTNPTLSVSPSNQDVPENAGHTTFTVLSNSAWTAGSDSAWLTVTPSGTGDGNIEADYLQNPYHINRIGTVTVTVAGLPAQMVTVTQASSTVSVREHSTDIIRLIPNPARGTFRIETGSMKFESLDVIIMDVSGRTVIQRNCKENADLKFDLSSSPEGCYFVKIVTEQLEEVQKLIMKR